jgi:hypothetical protein
MGAHQAFGLLWSRISIAKLPFSSGVPKKKNRVLHSKKVEKEFGYSIAKKYGCSWRYTKKKKELEEEKGGVLEEVVVEEAVRSRVHFSVAR